MYNLNYAAKQSEKAQNGKRVPLYYSFETNSVYVTPGKNKHFVTYLIRPNTKEEIEAAVERWKMM